MKTVAAIGSRPIRAHHSSHVHCKFLVWNRAVLYSVQETCTRKILYKKPCQTVKFLVQVSWLCVTTINVYYSDCDRAHS